MNWTKRADKLIDQIEIHRDLLLSAKLQGLGSMVTTIEKKIKALDNKLVKLLKPHLEGIVIVGELSDEDKQRARDYPVENYFDGKTKGIKCPFHDDKHPSASIKFNRLRCFTCNKSWDSISLEQHFNGGSFFDAVKRLR